ncbi:MAG: acetyl-CoA carboxylase biotin carboxylase subunit [Steroidobacteraceae bacterium]
MFDTILIANRGEIAVRVIKTARRLGIRTVAVFSEADARSLHVELADEAVCIGPAAAAESYLRGDKIIAVAKQTHARAIHPGYGFLSENAAFAQACADAGIVFIGPPIEAIRVMGSKSASKRLMSAASVPLVPGYHGATQDLARLQKEADAIGYPVLVKASAGGGGKGMRIVHRAQDFAATVAGAKRESKSAFADDAVLLEKYLLRPRHVEVQVFADTQGHCVYLFDRDCSIQRRHQKVIEEAPAPSLPEDVRARMGEAAVAAARAVNYVGAGTVEFLYEDGAFYFIEMNTRLQVEHPITEMITGLDLVEWQLRAAAGEALPQTQTELTHRGHAFEARIYAEDPERDFLPTVGRVQHLHAPAEDAHVRIDSGVRSGDEISVYYDPMIAKVVTWDVDRAAALRRLRRALTEYQIAGLPTNVAFLSSIAAHPAFAAAQIDTGFIERHRAELAMSPQPLPHAALAIASLATLLAQRAPDANREDPWHALHGWRANAEHQHTLRFQDDGNVREAILHFRGDAHAVEIGDRMIDVSDATFADGLLTALIDGRRTRARIVFDGTALTIFSDSNTWRLTADDPLARAARADSGSGHLFAPMPGIVVAVHVNTDDIVERGQAVMVLEAMKMELTIKAPAAGRVEAVHFAPGQQVKEGDELLTIASAPKPG